MKTTTLWLFLALGAVAGVTAGCGEESTGEKIEDAAEDAGDAVGDAVDDAGDAVKDATN